jgi:hypothetical protein
MDKGFSNVVLLIAGVLTVAVFAFCIYPKYIQHKSVSTPQTVTIGDPYNVKTDAQRNLEGFLDTQYSEYQDFLKDVPKNKITAAFPISIPAKTTEANRNIANKQGWVIETRPTNPGSQAYQYYVLTPDVARLLRNDPPVKDYQDLCRMNNFQVAGISSNNGKYYLVTSGEVCVGYDLAGKGVVSVYDLETGKKIPLRGTIPNNYPGTQPIEDGSATGILKDMYDKSIVLEYFTYQNRPVLAIFDISSGNLKQAIQVQ